MWFSAGVRTVYPRRLWALHLTRSCQSRCISSSDEAESTRGMQEQTATTSRALMGFIIRAAPASGGRRSKSRPSSPHLRSQRTPTRLTTNTTLPNPFLFFEWLVKTHNRSSENCSREKNNKTSNDARNHNDEQDLICCSSSKRHQRAERVEQEVQESVWSETDMIDDLWILSSSAASPQIINDWSKQRYGTLSLFPVLSVQSEGVICLLVSI